VRFSELSHAGKEAAVTLLTGRAMVWGRPQYEPDARRQQI